MTEATMRATVKNPTAVLKQAGDKTLYISKDAAVAVDKRGVVVTTYGKDKFDDNVLSVLKKITE